MKHFSLVFSSVCIAIVVINMTMLNLEENLIDCLRRPGLVFKAGWRVSPTAANTFAVCSERNFFFVKFQIISANPEAKTMFKQILITTEALQASIGIQADR